MISIMTWNVHRLKHTDKMNDAILMMKKKNVCLVVLSETHFDNSDCSEFSRRAEKIGYKCFHITRLMKRSDHGSDHG